MQPRVLISTDIGGNDKDDAQSLIHALLYANEINYRGFVATSSDASGVNGISPMNKIIDAYAKDLPNLREYDDFPDASALRGLIKQGATTGSWPGSLSDGAKHIISEAKKASPDDPLYLLSWGPIHDIARALYEAPEIVENVRVISIAGYLQDSKNPAAFNWMKSAIANNSDYRDLWWIDAGESFRGMYAGPNGENDPGRNLNWVKNNVNDHGALGELFHDSYTYDLYGGNSPDGLKMGDTPSLLYLLDNVNNDDPTLSSWGGQFRKSGLGPNTWVDVYDQKLGNYDGARSVYKHRDEVWGDFADRLDIAKDGVPGSQQGPAPAPTPEPEPTPQPEPVVEEPAAEDPPAPDPEPTPQPDPQPGPAPAPTQPPATPTDAGDITYDKIGTSGGDTIEGDGGSDKIDGAGGNDRLVGRGGSDTIDGGAGSDVVRAGPGDDTLVYVVSENANSKDTYVGSLGVDTLRIEITADAYASQSVQDDLARLETFMADKYDTGSYGGPSFFFKSFDLSVQATEKVEVVIIDADVDAGPAPADGADDTPPPVDDTPNEGPMQDDDAADANVPLPVFEITGTDGNDWMPGDGGVQGKTGAGGDDIVFGRGGDDLLAGGAGNDFVKGGWGDDTLVFVEADNAGAEDHYQGSQGNDTLSLYVTQDTMVSGQFADDLAAFETFVAENADEAREGGTPFQFESFSLSVQSVEQIEVYLYDLG